MSREIQLNIEPSSKPRSLTDTLNVGHVGVEFYVHHPRSSAPMMYSIFLDREDAEEDAVRDPDSTVFIREVSEWRVAP